MKISESKLRTSIRKMLFETTYNLYTTADKSAGKFVVDSDEEPPDDKSEDAANPSMVMSTQLTHEMPPIDDADFMPKNSTELASPVRSLPVPAMIRARYCSAMRRSLSTLAIRTSS